MKVYRASHTADIFTGMHFSDSQEEAQAYADHYSFGGVVREYALSGDIIDFDMESLIDFAAEKYDDGEDLGVIGRIFDRYTDEDVPAVRIAHEAAHEIADCGMSTVWQAIEGCSELLDLISEEAAFIRFDEISACYGDRVCTTLRYLGGGGSVELIG